MKSIKQMLRESLLVKSNKPLSPLRYNRRRLRELNTLLEKKIRVGDDIHKKLSRVNSPLSKNLLRFLNSDDIKDDANVDYVDYDKKNEKLFTVGYQDQRGNTKERLMKFNKLLTYLGGDLSSIKSYEVEELINHLKTADLSNLKVVDGKDILWAYHCDNYDEGETMGSCMRHGYAQSFLEIYTANPNQVKCLVLINPENNKVRGRALLWKLDDGETYMDRVYVTNNQYRVEFNNYAEEHGIQTKSPSDNVTLENGDEYDEYPYMDTFEYYTPYSGELSTIDGELHLQDTNGGDSGRCYSEVHGEHIPEDQAVYVDHIDDWVYDTEVVMTVDDQWVYRDSDDVVQIEVGEHEHSWALEKDTIRLYNGRIAYNEEVIYIDRGVHSGEYALYEDTTEDVNGDTIMTDEAVQLTAGSHEGDYGHEDDVYVIKNGDYEGAIVHENDLEEFEDYEYDEYR